VTALASSDERIESFPISSTDKTTSGTRSGVNRFCKNASIYSEYTPVKDRKTDMQSQ